MGLAFHEVVDGGALSGDHAFRMGCINPVGSVIGKIYGQNNTYQIKNYAYNELT